MNPIDWSPWVWIWLALGWFGLCIFILLGARWWKEGDDTDRQMIADHYNGDTNGEADQ
jgi:hypothetical protein